MVIAFDTMVAAHSLDENISKSLATQANLELGFDDWGKGNFCFGEANYPPSDLYGSAGMGVYCGVDTGATDLLKDAQIRKLVERQEQARLLKNLSFPGQNVFVDMELNGIWVDMSRVRSRREKVAAERDLLAAQLKTEWVPEDFRETADFENDTFLRKWIFGRSPDGLGCEPISFTDKTNVPKVDVKVLEALDHPATKLLVTLNKRIKNLNYFDLWTEMADTQDRIHPRFNTALTVTGRRSCDSPNLQNVPRDKILRTCLGAPRGWKFIEVDFSTLEVRIAAWFAEEETMLKVFADGRDIYTYTASILFGIPEELVIADDEAGGRMRQNAKVVVLGFIYKLSANGLVNYARDVFHVDISPEEAKAFRETFFNTYPKFRTWHAKQKKTVEKKFFVESPFGRRRHLMSILSIDEATRAQAERQAINSPVQGAGGDFNLAAMLTLHPQLIPEEIKLVGDIHDAVLYQVRDDVWEKWTYKILQAMENPTALKPFRVDVPVRMKADAKVGQYWGSGSKLVLQDFVSPDKVSNTWKGWAAFLTPEEDDEEGEVGEED